MPRLPRLHVSGGCYHVILRGNHRENIFSSDDDRRQLNTIVAEAIEKYRARIHAFCWMTNHLHALIQIADESLGKVVQRIAMKYSRYRHKELHTTGHLFERRHRAFLVDVDTYFLALLRYIHLNPVEAGMVNSADDYPWSSHHAYLGTEVLSWLTIDLGLGMFAQSFDAARVAYQSFINGNWCTNTSSNLVPSIDPRVIGTDRFLASLPPPRMKLRSFLTLADLASQVCEQENVSLEEVISVARVRRLSKARATIARRAIDERIASLHEVSRFLGRSPSSVLALVKRRLPN